MNEAAASVDATGSRRGAEKKRGQKSVWDHNFDILKVKYGYSWRWSFFSPHTFLGVDKTSCFGNKN
jgi:hypothetical protein